MSDTNMLSITKGDTRSFKVEVKTKEGVNFPLTGYTSLKFTAKDNLSKDDADAAVNALGAIDPVDDWKIDFTLTPTHTRVKAKDYTYDVQISDGVDNIHTVIREELLRITPEVTILP